ncbi:hypothetical protein [Labilibacter marinus]|uniref:hypothetical protein n=1 Tax=Labilibacter marinus TaxID=1477105 RepID=UPI00094FE89B|nr:hypothetical protein [Labilibacter marinus]
MRKLIVVLALAFMVINLSAQLSNDSIQPTKTPQKVSFKDKLYTGGSFGLSGNFSDYMSLRVSPIVGARISPKFYSGLGLEYIYTKDKRYNKDISAHDYGARLFGQYNFIPQLFAHAEFAGYSYQSFFINGQTAGRNFVPFIWLGGGYRQYISNKSFFSVRVLFDVLQDKHSPYDSGEPVISVGFGVGL